VLETGGLDAIVLVLEDGGLGFGGGSCAILFHVVVYPLSQPSQYELVCPLGHVLLNELPFWKSVLACCPPCKNPRLYRSVEVNAYTLCFCNAIQGVSGTILKYRTTKITCVTFAFLFLISAIPKISTFYLIIVL
jgi:hypothetical protein